MVKTDISVAVPEGTYGRVAPRSGLALKNFIDVGAGVVDADYRGPLGVVLFNFSETDFTGNFAVLNGFLHYFCIIVNKGDRIAQLILEKCVTCPIECCEVDNQTSYVECFLCF